MWRSKILALDDLALKAVAYRSAGKRLVLCHGDFDLLHIGHIRHLQQAGQRGDVLLVTITPDQYVNKGAHRPVFDERMRAEAVAALGFVDYVAVNQWPSAVETIKLTRPHVYAKGANSLSPQNYPAERLAAEDEAVKSVGGEMFYTEDMSFNTSGLINRYLPMFSREVSDYLPVFTAKHDVDEVLSYLQAIRSLKVLTVGETIIDEYQYCSTLGKAGKEPILAAQYLSSEVFAGGILAVANHVAAFCDHVGVLTLLGEHDSHAEFIREKLNPDVEQMFIYMDGAPTIVKRRFVERYPLQKLFEVYVMDDQISAACSEALYSRLSEVLPEYDLVIVTDYGHGMLTPQAIELLCSQSRFLAINVQTNAANRGFNTVSRYPRASYICVSENELRLEVRNRRRDLREIVLEVAERMQCDRLLVTRGQLGSLVYQKGLGFVEAPALSRLITDRVGAGDAVLSVTAPCVAQGAPMDVVGLIGNVVGAQAVSTVGHREYLEREQLFRDIRALLQRETAAPPGRISS